MTRTTYSVEMLTDWHVGSGTGQHGALDRIVRRDPVDGLPIVPAKTITGVWRDACETVARGLDSTRTPTGPSWSEWVSVLFGSQPALGDSGLRPAAVSIRPARYPASLRAAMSARPALRTSLTFARASVAIDPSNGRAIDQALRFEEYGRVGALLSGTLEVDDEGWSSAQRATGHALLVGAAALVGRLGANRRRGAGKCSLVVDPGLAVTDRDAAADELARADPPQIPDWTQRDNADPIDSELAEASEMRSLRLELLTPVCIPDRTVGNIVESRDFIPGSLLLPALLDVLGRGAGRNRGALHDAARSGRLTVTDATLEIGGAPGRRVPRAFTYPKGTAGLAGETVRNVLVESDDGSEPAEATKTHRRGYVGRTETPNEATLPRFSCPVLQTFTHAVIDDEAQRPTSAGGGVFTYTALPATTVLCAELRLPSAATEWLPEAFEIRIGRAKKDDYGQVTVQVEPAAELAAPRQHLDGEVFVWLLSDVLVRDTRLRLSTDPRDFATELGSALGVVLELRPSGDRPSWIADSSRVDSWHARWGLPRPSLVGLAAGSVGVFRVVSGSIDPGELARVASEGIGERRAEGFGRICFDDDFVRGATSDWNSPAEEPSSPAADLEPIKEENPEYEHACTVERAAWRRAISRGSATIAATADGPKATLGITAQRPGPAQLGSLRAMLDRLRGDRSDHVLSWIEGLSRSARRKAQWSGDDGPAAKITRILKDKDAVWEWLDMDDMARSEITMTTGGDERLRAELWAEAIRSLAFACIRRVATERAATDQPMVDA